MNNQKKLKQNPTKNKIQPISGGGKPNTRKQKKIFHKTVKNSLKT